MIMDVHCSACGEPWDTYHLWQDAVQETGLSDAEIKVWKQLPASKRLSELYRREFEAAGYQFGASILDVMKCPCCPPGAKPDPDKAVLKALIVEMHGDDEDGIAVALNEMGL